MTRKAPLLAALLVLAMVSAGALATTGPATGDDSTRSGGHRATEIDGHHRDEFDNPTNLTLYQDATVRDGELTLDRAVVEDEFDRFLLAPWTAVEGTVRIVAGELRTNSTRPDNATARLPIDMHDLELFMDLSPGLSGYMGPMVTLRGPQANLSFRHSSLSNALSMGLLEDGTYTPLTSADLTLTQDAWYEAHLTIVGDEISMNLGPSGVSTTLSIAGNFTALELGTMDGDSAAWDNVTLNKVGGSGYAVSLPVDLPEDTFWDTLQLSRAVSYGTSMVITILDAADDTPIEGLENVNRQVVSLSPYIDSVNVTSIRLRVEMTSNTTDQPLMQYWKVTWLGDPPRSIRPLGEVVLDEDVPEEDVIDLRTHFTDKLTSKDNLTFRVSYMSHSQAVRPVVDGHMLDVTLPTAHWHGSATYKIACSDGVLEVESAPGTVVVRPVNDPPVIRPIPRVQMEEDAEHVVNLTTYLDDVDTPIGHLAVRALSSHAEVSGQSIRLYYDRGNITERIELEVFDGEDTTSSFLEVVVAEVDDPPVMEELPVVMMQEDEHREIDMADFITDEDTPMEDLVLEVPDADVHASYENLTITLFYPSTGGTFYYTVKVSDGTTTLTRMLEVQVTEVNDPPSITKVGDMEPVEGELELNVIEGDSLTLEVVVVDEESTSFNFTLVSDWDGASLDGTTLALVAAMGDLDTYLVQVLVSDGKASAMVVMRVTVLNRNDPPTDVAITSPEDQAVYLENDTIELSAYAIDPDTPFGDELEFLWESSLDGPLGTGRDLEVTNLSVGTHTITLEVTDGEESVFATITLTVNARDDGDGDGGDGKKDDDDDSPGFGTLAAIAGLAGVSALLANRRRRRPSP